MYIAGSVLATGAPVLRDFSCLLTPLLEVRAAPDPMGQGFSPCGCGCCWSDIFPVRMRLLGVCVLVRHFPCRRLRCTQRTIQPAALVGGDFLRADAAAASACAQRAMQRPGVGDYTGRYRLGCRGEVAAMAVARVWAALNGGGSGCSR
ncbi:hypothetical protein B0H14DRAFT_2678807 [Mycena olivaceomarginata]|nr:hypothetical protein B0H14DRAFT_2678807 [Mycena olivaceomarginata]